MLPSCRFHVAYPPAPPPAPPFSHGESTLTATVRPVAPLLPGLTPRCPSRLCLPLHSLLTAVARSLGVSVCLSHL